MSEAAVMPRGNAVAVEVNELVRTDGRNRRAAATRRKIIEAAKAMIEETSEAPTVVGVARRADVSVRSVFQHFGDVESLFVTVADSMSKEIPVAAPPPADQPQEARIDALVEGLIQMFDKAVPLRVAAGQFVHHPALLERGLALRQQLRDATMEVFAPEFAVLSETAREELADAIGAALSLDAWIVLRRRDGLSLERAAAVWRLTLRALLAHGLGTAKQ
ncbi:transcriptional regulator, TetR family [Enhydrobacter aerosaccus]|uniref:Transcriptional regulator, TetR family n=1 Tax=Enhydrobacter aerosaccus TaxID=225324 RepID=A0A1T4PEB8_9HYPH|nr:TetR/AcrR family transcriptional regulator [Enhydrobacter aerosaccus]SJZ89915.1 transcriptional regulator, TetR family [Enhydrobacter aerosaccus]